MSDGNHPKAAAPASADASMICFRMNDFPARDRFEAWREIVGRALMKLEIEPINEGQCSGDLVLRVLPDLYMSNGVTSGMRFRRPPALIDSDDLVLQVSLGGGFRGHRHQLALRKGEAVLLSSEEPGLVSLIDEAFLIFRVPLRVMSPIVGDLDAVMARPISKANEALRLLIGYAGGIRDMPTPTRTDVRHVMATNIHDLIGLTLGATRDAVETANGRGLRAARLSAIKAYIAQRLGSADLSLGEAALRHRVTPRYVQMLFETEGTTFREFVLNARLLCAYRVLTDPRFSNRPVTSVALDAGFQDLSYFNRTFRRRFGDTPSGVRAAALD